ncbi:carcinoembryonic antigen-related cell adhesion molecule 1-like isoform X2 [Mugil cephalus]|uniref:carcinoembryonic antigen-related cell adhesion molecule 1-like isoform X2 n=1 Tax=Mugil cephalus TaxID=48193 RepID=UPI001FB62004|nr:carcinoembryonic antigen-related cell adhesion molecule 1-like isoform X2 [Mugil cephalus]
MDILHVLCVVSVAITGVTEGAGVLPGGPLNAAVGGKVTFTTILTPPEKPFISVSWNFGDRNIITSSSGNFTSAEYEDRITYFPSTGSLELRDLTLNDSGVYRVSIIPYGGPEQPGTIRLDVYEPVSSVTVTPMSSDLVEFNSSVRLSCSSSGSSLSFLWMNGSSQVTQSDRVDLTDGNSTLTIVSVTRYDQGPFRCHVFNPVSNDTSGPVNLSISYGPENIKVTLTSSEEYYEEGSDITMICSSESRPSAQFMWFVNGVKLSDTGPELRLMNIQMNQSGNYSCQAFNHKTLRYQTSRLSVVTVLEKISGASLHPSTNDPLIEGTSFNLTCEASGSIVTRNWRKDGSALFHTDNMTLHDNNRVLMFNTVTRKDSGEYFCNISNPISSDGAKYNMMVNYGPEKVQITGPSQIHLKETFKLTCFAESTPAATYTWMFNGSEILKDSAEFIKEAELSDSGSYTCQAKNDVTGRTSSVEHGLSVTESSGCSVGCIVGIVVGVCAFIVVVVVISYCICKKKKCVKIRSNRSTSTTAGGGGLSNAAFSSQELQYADITFVQNKSGGKVQVGSQNTSESEYTQVKVPSFPPTYDAHMQQSKSSASQSDGYDEGPYAQINIK